MCNMSTYQGLVLASDLSCAEEGVHASQGSVGACKNNKTRVREILFDPAEDPIGQHILVNGGDFKVVGAFESRKEGDEAEEETQAVFIPFTVFQQAFNYGSLVGWFSLTARKDVPASVVEKKAIAFLAERHQVAPNDVHAIGLIHESDVLEFFDCGG